MATMPSVYEFKYKTSSSEEFATPLLGIGNSPYLFNGMDYDGLEITLKPGTSFTVESEKIELTSGTVEINSDNITLSSTTGTYLEFKPGYFRIDSTTLRLQRLLDDNIAKLDMYVSDNEYAYGNSYIWSNNSLILRSDKNANLTGSLGVQIDAQKENTKINSAKDTIIQSKENTTIKSTKDTIIQSKNFQIASNGNLVLKNLEDGENTMRLSIDLDNEANQVEFWSSTHPLAMFGYGEAYLGSAHTNDSGGVSGISNIKIKSDGVYVKQDGKWQKLIKKFLYSGEFLIKANKNGLNYSVEGRISPFITDVDYYQKEKTDSMWKHFVKYASIVLISNSTDNTILVQPQWTEASLFGYKPDGKWYSDVMLSMTEITTKPNQTAIWVAITEN